MWRYKRFRRTTMVAALCLSILCGLLLARLGLNWPSLVCCIASCLLVGASLKRTFFGLAAAIAAGLVFGIWRGSVSLQELSRYVQYVGQAVTVSGEIKDDPAYDLRGNQTFRLQSVSIDREKQVGEIRVSTIAYQKLKRGDTVALQGKLKPGFSSYQAELSFARLVALQPTNNPVLALRSNFESGVRAGVAEPQASLGLGFVVGESSGVPKDVSDDMKKIGLTHIIVASGYNLTVLVRVARRLFARVSKYLTTLASLLLMVGFLTVTGFSPSMARASIVTGLLILTWHYGRKIHPITLLSAAAAVTAAVNPVYFWSDVGWYLSFTSFMGVLLLAPLVRGRLFGSEQPNLLLQICFETICAQLATLPVELFIFGKLALLAVPANILVDPFIPFAMVLTTVSGGIGMVLPALAGWAGALVNGLVGYMVWSIHTLAAFSWSQVAVKLSALGVAVICLAIVTAGIVVQRRLKFDYLESGQLE